MKANYEVTLWKWHKKWSYSKHCYERYTTAQRTWYVASEDTAVAICEEIGQWLNDDYEMGYSAQMPEEHEAQDETILELLEH